MKIVVTVKQVPDTNALPRLDADGTIARDRDVVLDAGDECGVEAALRIADANGGEVVLVSMGPASAREAVRKGLSMGADRGLLVTDDRLTGADALQTARVLAAAIAPEQPDLVICGTESADGSTGLVPPMVAELLGLPQLTFATAIDVTGDAVRVHRRTADGHQVVEAPLPALVTVTTAIAEPRYPSLKAIMAAKKKRVAVLSLADLDVTLGEPVETIEQIVDVERRAGGEIVEADGAVERILGLLDSLSVLAP